MNNLRKTGITVITLIGLVSFKISDTKLFEFSYPKRDNTAFTLKAENFKKFTKEWRGSDYYYYAESKDGIICSVLYYKLNDEEKLKMVDMPRLAVKGPEMSPAYPLAYFSNFSNLKKFETNNEKWGLATDDFMFREFNIMEYEGVKVKQKNMYGYCMADKDLFVSIHLSKADYTPADSVVMRQILNSLEKSK